MRGPNHLRTSGLGENDKRRDIHVFIDDGDRRGHWEMMAPWYTSTQMGSNGPSLGTTSDDGAKLPSDPDCELTRICSTISHSLGNLIIPLSEVWLPEWGVHNQGSFQNGKETAQKPAFGSLPETLEWIIPPKELFHVHEVSQNLVH